MIPDWITLSQTAGTGNATVTVTASSYTELLSRSAALTVSTTSRSANVTVSQVFDSSFSVSPTRVTGIPSALTYNYLDILADTTWEVYSAPDWLSFNEITGSGNSRITMLATGNTGTTRNGTVYLRNSRGIERTVYVEQVGAGQSVDTISVSPVSAFFPSSGDSVAISVTSNSTWSVTLPAWLSASVVSGSGNSVVTITATANTAATQAGYVVFSTANDTAQVSVSQDGYYVAPTASTVASANTIDPTGSTESNGVTANVSWTAVTSAPWITISPTSGINGYTSITIHAGENVVADRTGYVYIRSLADNTLLATITVSQQRTTPPAPTPSDYLTFTMFGDGNIVFGQVNGITIAYSKDDGSSWSSITSTTNGVNIPVSSGDTVIFSGSNSSYTYARLTSDVPHYLSGKLSSLGNCTSFKEFFRDSQGLLSANYLVLVNGGMYDGLFAGCSNLVTPPSLPATELNGANYRNMFAGCVSLTTAPELPATTLGEGCYEYMFGGCTSLSAAPALPSTALERRCYRGMFQGCTGLTTAPTLSADIIPIDAYNAMFWGCTSLTTAPDLPATTLGQNAYYSMFYNCTSLSATPIICATTLGYRSCYCMFENCSGLTTVTSELPATTLANNCYEFMFENCTNLTTAPDLPAHTLTQYCYKGMFYGCSNLSYIKCLATKKTAYGALTDWVKGVSNSGTFVKASGTAWTTGDSGRPSGWTVQDA